MSETRWDSHKAGRKNYRAVKNKALIIALVSTSLLIIATILFINSTWLGQLKPYGYLGIFVINIFAGGTVVIPIPALAVVFAFGSILNPFLVGLSAGFGEAIGSLGGYLAGTPANLKKRPGFIGVQIKMDNWLKRRGLLALLISSAIPNPLFIFIGAAAGALRYPVWKYFLCCFAGKSVKGMMVAWCGALGIKAILKLFGIEIQ